MSCNDRVHDIWSKTISSTPHFVEYDNTSMRHIVEYDSSSTTTIRRNLEISSTIKSKNDTYNATSYQTLFRISWISKLISDTLLSLSIGSKFRWKGVLKLSIYQPAGSFLRSLCDFLQTGDRFLYFHLLLARDMQIMRSFTCRDIVHCCYSTITI